MTMMITIEIEWDCDDDNDDVDTVDMEEKATSLFAGKWLCVNISAFICVNYVAWFPLEVKFRWFDYRWWCKYDIV